MFLAMLMQVVNGSVNAEVKVDADVIVSVNAQICHIPKRMLLFKRMFGGNLKCQKIFFDLITFQLADFKIVCHD